MWIFSTEVQMLRLTYKKELFTLLFSLIPVAMLGYVISNDVSF